jgi:hypothetical protein
LFATTSNYYHFSALEAWAIDLGTLFALLAASFLILRWIRSKHRQRKARAADPWVITETYLTSKTAGPRVTARGVVRKTGEPFLRVEVPGPEAYLPKLEAAVAKTEEAAPLHIEPHPTGAPNLPAPTEGSRSIPDGRRGSMTEIPGGAGARVAGLVNLVEIRVLGPVESSGWRTAPTRKVVVELAAYLAMHKDRAIQPDQLRAALWPGDERPEANSKTLRSYISLLRDAVGDELLPHAERGVGYRAGPGLTTDWEDFQVLAADSQEMSERDLIERLEKALELVRGAPFQGVEPGTFGWASTELLISEMEVAISSAARRVADARIGSGDYALASAAVTRGLVAVPFDFALWAGLLRAALGLGPNAVARARRDANAVLGGDARMIEGWIE